MERECYLLEEKKNCCIGQIFLSKDGTLEKSLLFILISQQEDGNANFLYPMLL